MSCLCAGARELDDDQDIFTDAESQLSWDGDSEDGNFSVSDEESDDQHLPSDDEDDVDCQDARPGTAAYYKERLNQQIYENAKLTVIQAVFLFFLLKQQMRISDTAFNMICRTIHAVLLPAGNLFPPSLYLMKQISGVEDLDTYEFHVCPDCELHIYPQAVRKDWKHHKDEHCPVCSSIGVNSPRFTKTNHGGGVHLRPRKVRQGWSCFESVGRHILPSDLFCGILQGHFVDYLCPCR